MPRKGSSSQSQWEFGDLFSRQSPAAAPTRHQRRAPKEGLKEELLKSTPPVEAKASEETAPVELEEESRRVLSVAEITRRIRTLLEKQVGTVWVGGEISNLRTQSSGHVYFTLKDSSAQLCCVLFRSARVGGRIELKDGLRVVAQGEITVYEPRGQHQLIVRSIEAQGVGALQAAFERLKARLQAEGLFDPGRKRPIPRFPRRIGVITSPTGAAIRDVHHVLQRRFARMEVVLAPCRVQGTGAAMEMVRALRALNRWSASAPERRLDAILLTRGGGSLEDLWEFNDEALARAIVASELPVVSAVGHEIDFTIADFVADLRAATPSAAAEILTAGYEESREWIARQATRLRRLADGARLEGLATVTSLARRLQRAHPRRRLNERMQRLDELQTELADALRAAVELRQERLRTLKARLEGAGLKQRMEMARRRLAHACLALSRRGRDCARRSWERVEKAATRLRLLAPDQVLARGYSITLDARTGRVLRSAAEASAGQVLRTRLYSGEVTSVVAPEAPGVKSSPGGREEHDQKD